MWLAFPGGSVVKNLPANTARSLGWEDPWRRKWQPTAVVLPRKSPGHRSLVGSSLWGRKESDMTREKKHVLHSLEGIVIDEAGEPRPV